jgi:hypothetical protein
LPAFTTLIQHGAGNSSQCGKARKRNKWCLDSKRKKIKSLYFVCPHRESTKAQLEQLGFSRFAQYKINI